MTKKQAIEYIKSHPEIYLKRDGSGKGWICPLCGSGSGSKGTGLTEDPRKPGHFTCWSCDGIRETDVIGIIGAVYHLDSAEAVKKAAEIYKISYDYQAPGSAATSLQVPHVKKTAPITDDYEDYKEFFEKCATDLCKTDYWEKRGLTEKTLKKYGVGFCADWRNPKAQNAPISPRLIVPTSKGSYLARDTRDNLTDTQAKYSKTKVGHVNLFNAKALQSDHPVFIVEGEIDALSVIEAGGEAVGLGGLSNINRLIDALKDAKPIKGLILSLDNDGPGQSKQAELSAALKKIKINFIEKNIAGQYKDANEALCSERESFFSAVKEAIEEAEEECLTDLDRLEKSNALNSIESFTEYLRKNQEKNCISTGFKKMDDILDGGLYPGLYILGAISSLGKTTFCLQIADQVAQSGKDVLIFSLEMGKFELMAKSLSRLTCIRDLKSSRSTTSAKTTRGILMSRITNQEERDLLNDCMDDYMSYAHHIYIEEGAGDITVDTIRKRIERHIALKKEKPVVLIDYLQIIAPLDRRCTDKQNTDQAVSALKRITRDYDIPVIGISSFNRDNYTSAVNMASFKESGAIEYSSDILIGLQYADMEDVGSGDSSKNKNKALQILKENVEKSKRGEFQEIECKILKNRNGSKDSCYLQFLSRYNYFRDAE